MIDTKIMELFDPFLEEAESFIECPIINWKEGSIFNKTSDDDSSWLNDLMLLQIKTQQIIQGDSLCMHSGNLLRIYIYILFVSFENGSMPLVVT